MPSSDNITQILQDVEHGRNGAMDELMRVVYDDLQRIAERRMSEHFGRGLPGVTMEPAALVNESFLRLIKQRKAYDNRGQFFAIATRTMLRVLMDYERRRRAAKRGGGHKPITLSIASPSTPARPGTNGDVIEVDALIEALDKLEQLDRRKADVVKLRVVWGLEMREIAEALEISLATVERDWAFAKAWLAREAVGDG